MVEKLAQGHTAEPRFEQWLCDLSPFISPGLYPPFRLFTGRMATSLPPCASETAQVLSV